MRWYFDYISPYAYLQSTRLSQLKKLEQVECVPVLFAGLLEHWGNVGPAEIVPKRAWTFRHAVWLAHKEGVVLNLPESHPFNPLPLLRLGIALGNSVEVVTRLFEFVWVEGHVPQNEQAFAALLDELDIPLHMTQTPAVKSALLENGAVAISQGVFGVPTIERSGELFWGYDATDMALAHLQQSDWPADLLKAAAELPQGPARRRQ